MSLHKSLDRQTKKILLYKHLLSEISQNNKLKESGFTLIELLVAMVILTIVVALTGTGLVFVMSKNLQSDSEVTQQSNLRRALDFIGDEVKSSSVLYTTTTPSTPASTTPPGPGWTLLPTASSASALYLEIPTLVDGVTPSTSTITIANHGFVKGNAVKLSGILPAGMDTTTTYYIGSALTDPINTFQIIKSDGNALTFSALPTNFAVRRLVLYYVDANSPNTNIWKGERVLYRSTGNCAASSNTSETTNCLVMVDSLSSTLPFVPTITGANQVSLSINGYLCTPTGMTNTQTSSNKCTTNNASVTAIARATLR